MTTGTTKERVMSKRKILSDKRKIQIYDTVAMYLKVWAGMAVVCLLCGLGGGNPGSTWNSKDWRANTISGKFLRCGLLSVSALQSGQGLQQRLSTHCRGGKNDIIRDK